MINDEEKMIEQINRDNHEKCVKDLLKNTTNAFGSERQGTRQDSCSQIADSDKKSMSGEMTNCWIRYVENSGW